MDSEEIQKATKTLIDATMDAKNVPQRVRNVWLDVLREIEAHFDSER